MAMRPDIILHGDCRTLIIDVKYKLWESWRKNRESQRADLFQVMSYAAAHRARYHSPQRDLAYGLLFPIANTTQEVIRDRFDELGMDFFIFFLGVPLEDRGNFDEQ